MKVIKQLLITILILGTLLFSVHADSDMKLLAVTTQNGIMTGSGADLSLSITKGTGNVFMDTFPFTKLDTQMSTRYAKEIACNYLDEDCSDVNFFYTIRANTAIIGGPSAGASITFLTISKLKSYDVPQNIAITGTINLGGLIGKVGGVKEKIEAASSLGIKKVFIPTGDRFFYEDYDLTINVSDYGDIYNFENNNSNKTKLDLVEYGKTLDVEVIEVASIDDLICSVYNKNCDNLNEELNIDDEYQKTMLGIGINLCNRTNLLVDKINNPYLTSALKTNTINMSLDIDIASLVDLFMKRRTAFTYEKYYSMASFCFSANLILQDHLKKDLTRAEVIDQMEKLTKSLQYFREQISKKEIKSITDLQTYIIVKERLYETEDYLNVINTTSNNESILKYSKSALSFGTERFYSASMWSEFFDKDKNYFEMDSQTLKNACLNKIFEAQERVEYLRLYFPSLTKNAQAAIDIANKEFDDEDYAYCLFKASKAKAQIDAMLSSFATTNEDIDKILNEKQKVAQRSIKRQQDKKAFPILGFSYYEYAQTLSSSNKTEDKISALIYYDYAIEFSNLDLYFKKSTTKINIDWTYLLKTIAYTVVFIAGIMIGAITTQIMSIKPKPVTTKRKVFKRKTKKAN
ncbi:hypothetical protein JXM83_01645 [Candidatus Woesearchaeota archaeon]|nr:hypothetical protein [Candidatus Woesearchaeota archaeon]